MKEGQSFLHFLSVAGTKLAGQYVEVYRDEMPIPPYDAAGLSWPMDKVAGKSTGVEIIIRPDQTGSMESYLATYFHEVAHTRLRHHDAKLRNGDKDETMTFRHEKEAYKMAELWTRYSDLNYEYHLNDAWKLGIRDNTPVGVQMCARLLSVMRMPERTQEHYDREVLGMFRNAKETDFEANCLKVDRWSFENA